MKTWIALLRGINVGGKHKVQMKELIKIMEAAGFSGVKTYIQSGNVIFDKPTKAENEIRSLIDKHFGFKPEVFVLSEAELKKAILNNPYKKKEGKTVHFFFCNKVPMSFDTTFLDTLRIESEEYKLVDKVFYLHAPEGIGRSRLVEKMGKAFPGVTMTARNLNTINKLAEMLA